MKPTFIGMEKTKEDKTKIKKTKAGQKVRRCSELFSVGHNLVSNEFVPEGQTVNKKYYLAILFALANLLQMVGITE